MKSVGLLDLCAKHDGWRDEMASWMVTSFQSYGQIDNRDFLEVEISLIGPWTPKDENQARLHLESKECALHNFVNKASEVSPMKMGERYKTISEISCPVGTLPVWKEEKE